MKKTTIIIDGQPFTYDDECDDISYAVMGEISVADAKQLLENTKRLFGEAGIFFFLGYGTLLGAIREKGVIKGDEDVDIITFDEKTLISALPFLQKNGLKVCRIDKGNLYSFRNGNNSFIDVYILAPVKWGIWAGRCMHVTCKYYPASIFKKFKEIDFLGEKYYVPQDPEKALDVWYGKGWRSPVRGHGKWKGEISSHYYWRVYVINVIKKLVHYFVRKK